VNTYKKSEVFPYEAFVERAVKKYFEEEGFRDCDDYVPHLADLDVHMKNGEQEWRIECKGKTAAISVDFNTGLGQLLKKMDDENSLYALALPDIPSFREQTNKVPKRVRKLLNISWIWVREDGGITVDLP